MRRAWIFLITGGAPQFTRANATSIHYELSDGAK